MSKLYRQNYLEKKVGISTSKIMSRKVRGNNEDFSTIEITRK